MENRTAYQGFAEVYDLFMDNVPYEEWGAAIVQILKEYGILEGIIFNLDQYLSQEYVSLSDFLLSP